MFGFTGKLLHVDLTNQKFKIESPDEDFYRKYMGGSGMAADYLFRNTRKGIDPLGPENLLIFAVGPLAGAAMSGASRHSVVTKSPNTGTIASSEAGGYFAPELKFAGFDLVIISGKAEKPVYLWIHDGEFEIKDAANVWGKVAKDAQKGIREELGDNRARVCLIGPAGEKLVKYACISNELAHYNGRNGVGAVMGSKNLKAIAVRGTKKPEFFDKEVIEYYSKEAARRVATDFAGFKQVGTINCVDANILTGGLPTNNWSSGNIEGEDNLKMDAWCEDFIKPGTCWACSLSCKRSIDPKRTTELDAEYGGPEYETVGMCGSNLGITDRTAIAKINEFCAMYGMDTISFGGTVGFAMDCFENGMIDETVTGGLELRFGNSEAAIKLAEMTGKREGFGDLIAEGTGYLADKWNARHLAVLVKNKEFPAHMPQTKASLALAYAVVPDGSDHVHSEHDATISVSPIGSATRMFDFSEPQDPAELNLEKARFMWKTQITYGISDMLPVCLFLFGHWTMFDYNDFTKVFNAATGWNTNLYELMIASERRLNLFRAYNAREGYTDQDDILPKKMFQPLKGGVSDGVKLDEETFNKVREYYYQLAGWDESGNPKPYKLREFGLEWCLDYC